MNHNGGRSGVNLNGLLYSTEYALLNFIQSCDGWHSGAPTLFDINGFPQTNPPSPISTSLVPEPTSGNYFTWVLKWVGGDSSSSMKLDMGAPGVTVLEGASFVIGGTGSSLTTTGGNGRIKFTYGAPVGAFGQLFSILSIGAVPFSKIGLVRFEHESNYDNGEIWNPDFLTKYRAMNLGLVRFLNLAFINGSNAAKWAYRPLTTIFSMGVAVWPPNAWGGTISGTNTYTASAATDTPGSWAHLEVFQGIVSNANTVTNPTINIGARGAKLIKNHYAAALAVGEIAAGADATFVYDSTLDCVLYHPGGATGGMPIEYQVDLCNQTGSHGWFQIPHLADDNYITQLSSYVKANLNSTLRAYFEYSNEVWNFSGGFPQTYYAQAKGAAAGIPSGNNEQVHYWYAKRFTEVANLISSVFGAQPNFRRVIGVQSAGVTAEYDQFRFQGADLVGPPVAPNRPIDKAECIAGATYYYGLRCGQFDGDYNNDANMNMLKGWADDYASGTPTLMASAIASVDADVRNSGFSQDLNSFKTSTWVGWNSLAVTYAKKFIEYEGALSINAPSAARLIAIGVDPAYSARIATLFAAYRSSELVENTTLKRYNDFITQSNGEFPNQFQIAGSDQWSIKANLYDATSKNEEAIQEFNFVTPGLQETPGAKGKRKKKVIRGPYSDPLVYDEYIKKAIAEREEKPEQNVELAVVQEALVAQIEERQQTGYEEPAALSVENQLLSRLAELESKNKRLVSKVHARQHQIDAQLEQMKQEEEKIGNILILLHEL